jgi:hypothetical protein
VAAVAARSSPPWPPVRSRRGRTDRAQPPWLAEAADSPGEATAACAVSGDGGLGRRRRVRSRATAARAAAMASVCVFPPMG